MENQEMLKLNADRLKMNIKDYIKMMNDFRNGKYNSIVEWNKYNK